MGDFAFSPVGFAASLAHLALLSLAPLFLGAFLVFWGGLCLFGGPFFPFSGGVVVAFFLFYFSFFMGGGGLGLFYFLLGAVLPLFLLPFLALFGGGVWGTLLENFFLGGAFLEGSFCLFFFFWAGPFSVFFFCCFFFWGGPRQKKRLTGVLFGGPFFGPLFGVPFLAPSFWGGGWCLFLALFWLALGAFIFSALFSLHNKNSWEFLVSAQNWAHYVT